MIDGGVSHFHPETGLPLTVRERARIQGFPDDFIFVMNDKQFTNTTGMKQTGKAMPIEFTSYITNEFKRHMKGKKSKGNGKRIIKPTPLIEKTNKEYGDLK